jgi:hypothetical protein
MFALTQPRLALGGCQPASALLSEAQPWLHRALQPSRLRRRAQRHGQTKSALGIDADDLQILNRDALVAEVAGHLLAFEDLARILALAGGAVRTVRNRDAVCGAQAAEVPALHGAGEALADADASDINLLARDEVLGRDHRADRQQVIFRDAEFANDRLRLHLGARELTTISRGLVLRLGGASGELHGVIAIALRFPRRRLGLFVLTRLLRLQRNCFASGVLELFGVHGAAADDLAAGEIEHGDRDVRIVFTEDAHHADLARDDASATGSFFSHRYQPSTWI